MPCGKKPPLHPERPRPFFTEKGFSSFLLMRPLPERIFWKIKKADPEDIKGVHFKYTFRHLPYIEKCREW